MTKMPQFLVKNILTDSFIKYKLIDGRKMDNGVNPRQAEIPGFGAGLLLPTRLTFVQTDNI
jgi:hypothetical protein